MPANGIGLTSLTDQDWNKASLIFAEQSSGVIHCVRGEKTRTENAFDNIEHVALQSNRNVSKIVYIDPDTSRLKREEVLGGSKKMTSPRIEQNSSDLTSHKMSLSERMTGAKAEAMNKTSTIGHTDSKSKDIER